MPKIPQQIGHRRGATSQRGTTQGKVANRPHVLLELTRLAALDGQVSGIVRPRGHLIDHHFATPDKELHTEQPDHLQRLGGRKGHSNRFARRLPRGSKRGPP